MGGFGGGVGRESRTISEVSLVDVSVIFSHFFLLGGGSKGGNFRAGRQGGRILKKKLGGLPEDRG